MNQPQGLNHNNILFKIISQGHVPGSLCVVIASAGMGKTAMLVHSGLYCAMQEKRVLHIALGQTTDHVKGWYDAVQETVEKALSEEEKRRMSRCTSGNRVIQTYSDRNISARKIEQTVDLYINHLEFVPDILIVDGFEWDVMSVAQTAAFIGAMKSVAFRTGAELWMSAQTRQKSPHAVADRLMPPCDVYEELIERAIVIESDEGKLKLRVLKDMNSGTDVMDSAKADRDFVCLSFENGVNGKRFPASAYTLLSGGAQGTEALFGQCAEKHGLQEINYSFEGHPVVRKRGLVLLSADELIQGDVSEVYLATQMNRTYPKTRLFKKVLQSIWHQVNTSGEVFVVGSILPNNTVRGGTGWAAELAKHWQKPLYVFDQERLVWFTWNGSGWDEVDHPVITKLRFTGTGTRFPVPEARTEIEMLFKRSFSQT